MKEDRAVAEGALEEARCKEVEQRSRADSLKQELEVQRTQVQRHLTQVPPFPSPLPSPLPSLLPSSLPSALPSHIPCPLFLPPTLPQSLHLPRPPGLSFPSRPWQPIWGCCFNLVLRINVNQRGKALGLTLRKRRSAQSSCTKLVLCLAVWRNQCRCLFLLVDLLCC